MLGSIVHFQAPSIAHALSLLGGWLFLQTLFLTIAFNQDPLLGTAVTMRWLMIIAWIVIIGGALFLNRVKLRIYVRSMPFSWQLKFIIFSSLLALCEEAIAMLITSSTPVFGLQVGDIPFTATVNFLDLITYHSVVVFIPMFATWAWLLNRYAFLPVWVFLLFGITGTIAEASLGGLGFAEFAYWIFVYGTMVYLPAYCIPKERGAKKPNRANYLAAIILPLLPAFLVSLSLSILFPHHPRIHF